MKIEWKKVTWYSKLFAVVLFLLTFYIAFQLGRIKATKEYINLMTKNINTTQTGTTAKKIITISITSKDMREENFNGTMPVIVGPEGSVLVSTANEYIQNRVKEFRNQANFDVPDMRKKFGADSPTANYTIDIKATYIKGNQTESIVLSDYAYTGGANGNSLYKVITTSISLGKILNLSDVVSKDKQDAFTEFMKDKLDNWVPEGSTGPVVFEATVKDLKFSSFTNWSIDGKNLNIYFDKYAVGPGVLGAVVFPLPLEEVKNFLNENY